ncbi:uncharacterized protein A4U43_C07F980 [Asparagus officinalis]|uniref:Copper transport protein n=1 Tax=Asparagus officinalis TaxID=4686 RepID=A0A5P1EAC1_ASPOF|nr:copper transporter 6-like [Asparagus officinalis]ONK62157.1 uncharacterized protein A4U43_C07F980 [Asparagus officinalis]
METTMYNSTGTGTMDMSSKMMHMTFFWGSHVDILFSGWPGDHGVGMYLLALLLVFLASFLVECCSYAPVARPRQGIFHRGLTSTVLVVLRTGLSYLVMLAVMSFNVGVLIVAIAGHGVGFLVFGSGFVPKLSPVNVGVQPGDQQTAVPPMKC